MSDIIKFKIESCFSDSAIKEYAIDYGWQEFISIKIEKEDEPIQYEQIDNPETYLDFVCKNIQKMIFDRVASKTIGKIQYAFQLKLQEEISTKTQPLLDSIKVEYENLNSLQEQKEEKIEELEQIEEIKTKPSLLKKIIDIVWGF